MPPGDKTKTNEEIEQAIRDALPEELCGEFNDLLRERDELKFEAKMAQDERDDLQDQLNAAPDEYDFAEQEEALEAVKFWMHDVLYLGKPMRDPRRILRQVEEALGT
jgi:hypothetical protein